MSPEAAILVFVQKTSQENESRCLLRIFVVLNCTILSLHDR